ncbi:MazG nucleotide pyrophosphohydrolase domain-containing protein [Legionella erythra]|uniref:Nucleotide pyrophosphohydrolase n=1 Tax=Legionella erythra TaxID=448 RepID=A0A0W0TGD3_LEGER|nr:MazG nucleotide pyrophosphohydrolase domain-containing protein [Legionella erythra]KTC94614.1 nucleotide pyrophosphohydrolase [Legionella erythra]
MTDNALQHLLNVEKEARDFGFLWPDAEMIIDQALSECEEVREALRQQQTQQRVQEEVGDLLHTAISLCFFLGFDVQETLAKTSVKFATRMEALKAVARERGYVDLKGQSIALLGELWQQAKLETKDLLG